MTGYESKKAMAQDKLEQWDTPSEAFNEWWNGEYDDSTNPFTKHSLAYWAFAGWQAALAQPEQEPVAWADIQKEAQQIVESKFLWKKFIDGTPLSNDIACWMADFAQQYTAPPQRPWVDLTPQDLNEIFAMAMTGEHAVHLASDKLKEKNNGT